MLKGKSIYFYTLFKLLLFAVGYIEYTMVISSHHLTRILAFVSILLINSLFRQFYLYKNDYAYKYGKISICIDYALALYLAFLQPVYIVIIFLTTTIFESVAAHSIKFGGSLAISTILILFIIDTTSQQVITDYFNFYMGRFVSYGFGFLLILGISALASLQFREKEKVEKANKELELAYEQLMDNAVNLQELSVEKERTRMAREIHDTLAHTLTAIVVQLEACKKLIDIDPTRAKTEIEKAQESTRVGLSEVKRTIKALRPQALENSNLQGALRKLIQDSKEHTQVTIHFNDHMLQELDLTTTMEVSLYRVIQESITNAIRHGKASFIDLSIVNKDNFLVISILDNGKGCSHIKEGYGLKGINERIKGLNGTVIFTTSIGKGFQTEITIPYKGEAKNED